VCKSNQKLVTNVFSKIYPVLLATLAGRCMLDSDSQSPPRTPLAKAAVEATLMPAVAPKASSFGSSRP